MRLAGNKPETQEPTVSVRTAMLILALCFGLRLIDVFVIRSDAWFGEQVVTKVLGLAIVVGYALRSGYGLDRIGFRKTPVSTVIWISLVLTTLVMATTFLIKFLFLEAQGAEPIFVADVQGFTFTDQGVGQKSLLWSSGFLAFNLVNATMEESLFRGLLLTRLAATMSRMRANAVQAVLFGLWHIVWPLRWFYDGQMTLGAAMTYGAGYILVATMMGFV